MARFLFVFGFESPQEWETNAKQGTDFESSKAIWVVASSKGKALDAGRPFAEGWVERLYQSAGVFTYKGWSASDFAYWIEEKPLEKYSELALETFDEIAG